MINTTEARIKIHEYWMAFRRNYNKIKEGHRPKITHQEVEDMLFHIISDFDRVEEIILKPSTLLSQPSAEGIIIADKQNPQHALFYICPKCKGRCIERMIGKSKVYDCQNCKDQISSEAIIVAD